MRSLIHRVTRSVFAAFAVLFTLNPTVSAAPLPYTGVNLAGGEFGPILSGEYLRNTHYFTYPTADEIDYFASKGMNIIRVPFHWEILQPKKLERLDPLELARFKGIADYASSKGMVVILDPHNNARYWGQVVGGADLDPEVLADFWARMATVFKSDSHIWFGLTNEPHDMPNEMWLADANAAIAAIRKAGAKNMVLVPGNAWSGAPNWMNNGHDNVMLGVKDPANNWMFEPHCYLDADTSGTHNMVVSATIGVERLTPFTQWCKKHKFRAFLGEFAAPNVPNGREAINNMLTYMESNNDVWTGYTWWAAGPRWAKDYLFLIEPQSGTDSPLLSFLDGHLHK